MQRITDPTVASTLPAASSTGSAGYFQDPAPGAGSPTIVTPDWANGVQEELIAVITAAGLTPSITDNAQLLAAIKELISSDILVNSGVGYTASTVLPTSDAHSIVFFTGNSAATFTLPAASAASAYSLPFVISNQGNASLSIAVPSGDGLDVVTAVLKPGQVCALINDGATSWHHLWQESVTIGDFGNYGNASNSGTSNSITASASFTTNSKCIIVAVGNGGTGSANANGVLFTSTGATVLLSQSNWASTSTDGNGVLLASAPANTAVTLSFKVTAASSSNLNAGFIFFCIPVA